MVANAFQKAHEKRIKMGKITRKLMDYFIPNLFRVYENKQGNVCMQFTRACGIKFCIDACKNVAGAAKDPTVCKNLPQCDRIFRAGENFGKTGCEKILNLCCPCQGKAPIVKFQNDLKKSKDVFNFRTGVFGEGFHSTLIALAGTTMEQCFCAKCPDADACSNRRRRRGGGAGWCGTCPQPSEVCPVTCGADGCDAETCTDDDGQAKQFGFDSCAAAADANKCSRRRRGFSHANKSSDSDDVFQQVIAADHHAMRRRGWSCS